MDLINSDVTSGLVGVLGLIVCAILATAIWPRK